ncbi:MAG: hypothetical protein M1832_004068 [Thelocarpon impressellum]|nr:MAG: hypothetical protein M1832_004068 [Thelocarpon impressellum]
MRRPTLPPLYLVSPVQLAIKQLPPHPLFTSLPEPIKPVYQVDLDNSLRNVPSAEHEVAPHDIAGPVEGSAHGRQWPPAGAMAGLPKFVGDVLDQGRNLAAGLVAAPGNDTEAGPTNTDPAGHTGAWSKIGVKTYGPNQVEIFRRDLRRTGREDDLASASSDPSPVPPETWFARRSSHANDTTDGNATLREFKLGLIDRHSEKERDYAPDVLDARRVLGWDIPKDVFVNNYTEIEMGVFEMCHRLPAPFKNRVFPVLVISAQASETSFLVVQIPVRWSDLELLPNSSQVGRAKNAVIGNYAAVEFVYTDEAGTIHWIMATSSDAGGVLPFWMQNRALPSQIAKDVPLFLKWVKQNRTEPETTSPRAAGKPKRFLTLGRKNRLCCAAEPEELATGPDQTNGVLT